MKNRKTYYRTYTQFARMKTWCDEYHVLTIANRAGVPYVLTRRRCAHEIVIGKNCVTCGEVKLSDENTYAIFRSFPATTYSGFPIVACSKDGKNMIYISGRFEKAIKKTRF